MVETCEDVGFLPVTVAGGYAKHSLLALNTTSGKAELATASTNGELILGFLTQASFADGDKRTVRLLSHPGTMTGIAAGTIALAGGVLTAAASGEVEQNGSGAAIGGVIAAAAANDYFEFRHFPVAVDKTALTPSADPA